MTLFHVFAASTASVGDRIFQICVFNEADMLISLEKINLENSRESRLL